MVALCPGLPWSAQCCHGLTRAALVCPGLPTSTQIYSYLSRSAQVDTQVYPDLTRCLLDLVSCRVPKVCVQELWVRARAPCPNNGSNRSGHGRWATKYYGSWDPKGSVRYLTALPRYSALFPIPKSGLCNLKTYLECVMLPQATAGPNGRGRT